MGTVDLLVVIGPGRQSAPNANDQFTYDAALVQTPIPVISTPVYAGATSVSGTAAGGASVILTVGGVAQPAVTADPATGAWTVPVSGLTNGETLLATAQVTGDTVSNAATATVTVQPQTATPTIKTPVYTTAISVSGTAADGASVILTVGGVTQPAVTADPATGAWAVSVSGLTNGETLSATAQVTGDTVSKAATATVTIQNPVPEFPSSVIPTIMIIGMLGTVLFIQRIREH
jgi:hypothetical protein